MSDFSNDFVRLLKLGDESTWREAFQPLYAVAWKTAYKLGLSSDKEAQEYAFDFLRKLPFKISSWDVNTWEEVKAHVIADVLQGGIVFLDELALGSLRKWKKMFKENVSEAKERLICFLLSIREIISLCLNELEKRLFSDFLVRKKELYILKSEYGLDAASLKDACQSMMDKLRDGLHKFGLGWTLEKG